MSHSITFNDVYLGDYGLVVTDHNLLVGQQASFVQLKDKSSAGESWLPPKVISLQVAVTGESNAVLKTNLDNIRKALNERDDKELKSDIQNDRYWLARFESFNGAFYTPILFLANLTFTCYDPLAYGIDPEIDTPHVINADPKTIEEITGGTAIIEPIYTLVAGEALNAVTIKVENTDTGEELIWSGSLVGSWTVDALSYTTRKKGTIDHTKIDAALANFPVLVKLTAANFDFAKANADGFDIRFTDSDGSTLLKYERERHDATNSWAEYWVKIPTVSDNVDTVFYIYYRTTDTADGADPTNVWDANHKAVWHMNDETTATILDSTSNDADGTKKAANHPIEVDAKIAKGQDFEESDGDYIALPILANWNNAETELTVECLIKIESLPAINGTILYHGDDGNFSLSLPVDGFLDWAIIESAVSSFVIHPSTPLFVATWYHITATWKKNDYIRLYINTVAATPVAVNDSFLQDKGGGFPTRMGCHPAPAFYYDGILDEVRVSNTVRTAAWDKASYHSAFNTLLTISGEDFPGQTLVIDTARWIVEKVGTADMANETGQFPRLLPDFTNHIKVTGFGILGDMNIKYRNRFL